MKSWRLHNMGMISTLLSSMSRMYRSSVDSPSEAPVMRICWWFETPWASYQIRKIVGCACAGNVGNIFPHRRLQMKPLVSNPGIHHGTCVTHVPWCMSGLLTSGGRETFPAFSVHAQSQFYVSGKRHRALIRRNCNAVSSKCFICVIFCCESIYIRYWKKAYWCFKYARVKWWWLLMHELNTYI